MAGVAEVLGLDIVDVVDTSSSGSRSESASYRLEVVMELALPDRCTLVGRLLVGEVYDRFLVRVFRGFRGTINCGSAEPSFWLISEPVKLNILKGLDPLGFGSSLEMFTFGQEPHLMSQNEMI